MKGVINIGIFLKRPLLCTCILFLLSVVLGYVFLDYLTIPLLIALLAVGCVSLICLGVLFAFKKLRLYTCLYVGLSTSAVLLALLLTFNCFGVKLKAVEEYYDREITIEGYVVETVASSANFNTYKIVVESVDGEETRHTATLICSYDCPLEPGFAFALSARGQEFEGTFGGYDEKLYRMAQGIAISYLSENDQSLLIVNENVFDLRIFFAEINQTLSRVFLNNTDEETGGLAAALLLGNREHLSHEVNRNFTRTGTSHILSLSGMHMSIIMGLLMFLLKKLRVNHKLIAILLSVCSVGYLYLTGFSLAATRSVLMLLSVYAGMFFFARSDPLTALGLAAAVIVGVTPYSILDAGFWMSFSATLGLLVYLPPIDRYMSELFSKRKLLRLLWKVVWKILALFAATLFAMIPLAVIMCIFIQETSLYTMLASAVLSLPTAGMIVCSLFYLVFHKVPILCELLRFALEKLAHFMIDYTAETASSEEIVVSLHYPFTFVFMLLLGGALLYSLAWKSKNMARSLIPFASVAAAFAVAILIYDAALVNTVKTDYLNVSSQSDMLVVSNNKEVIICDIGNGSSDSYNEALEAMQNARATEVKAILLTRYSHKHTATLAKVFARELVKELWVPQPKTEDDYYKLQALAAFAHDFGVDVFVYEDGERLTVFDSVSLSVSQSYIDRSAVPITVLSIAGKQERLTYISPAFNESKISAEIHKLFNKTDYFIFGNRGPKTKTQYTLPELADPQLVIFADDTRVAYFNPPENYGVTYAKAEDGCEIYMGK